MSLSVDEKLDQRSMLIERISRLVCCTYDVEDTAAEWGDSQDARGDYTNSTIMQLSYSRMYAEQARELIERDPSLDLWATIATIQMTPWEACHRLAAELLWASAELRYVGPIIAEHFAVDAALVKRQESGV